MTRKSLYFVDDRAVEIRASPVPEPGPEELLIESELSAISPGTELLIYRGRAPTELAADETLDALPGSFDFPLQYGYATVGRVTRVGREASEEWQGRRVFAFNPHESHFTAPVEGVVPVPEDVTSETAALLPNVETAVNFLHDGGPMLGERVAVFGQGVVGLLTTSLLADCPLSELLTVDLYDRRRELSRRFGADGSLDPTPADASAVLRDEDGPRDGADLSYELSGSPDALDDAIAATGYGGRVVVGSWYGRKPAELDLGGRFHRSRVRILASQVSTIDPDHRGRWDKTRRLDLARDLLADVETDALVTHRVPIDDAGDAYRLLDERPEDAVQVLLTYD
jgi:alcohol dehydrogenase